MKVKVKKVKGSRADGIVVPEFGLVNLIDGQAEIEMPEDRYENFVEKIDGMANYDVEVLKPAEPVKEEEPVVEEPKEEKEEKKAEKKPAKKTPAKKRTTKKRR